MIPFIGALDRARLFHPGEGLTTESSRLGPSLHQAVTLVKESLRSPMSRSDRLLAPTDSIPLRDLSSGPAVSPAWC